MAQHVTVFPSEARTASTNSFDFKNSVENGGLNNVGMLCVIDCTAIASSPSVVFTIEGKDPTSGKYYTILASAPIVGTGTTILRVHPEFTAASNTVAKDFIPAVWRIKAVAGNSNSITYSVGVSLI